MAIHGNSWQFMAIHGNSWQSMAIHGNSWQFMAVVLLVFLEARLHSLYCSIVEARIRICTSIYAGLARKMPPMKNRQHFPCV
jgi:hypothetical protein